MFRRPKLLIASLVLLAFGIAILCANGKGRLERLSDELVEATSVLPENEGKLVIVSGTPELAGGGTIVDEEANLQVENAVYYSRIPLQRVYVEKSRKVVIDKGEDKFSEVDDVTETEYYVAKEWVPARSDREARIKNSGMTYENPRPVNLDSYHAAGDLRLCGFRVSAADVSEVLTTKERWFTPQELWQSCGDYVTRSEVDLKAVADADGHGVLASGTDIGDVCVFFTYDTLEAAEAVTVVARQRGDRLVLEEEDFVDGGEQVRPGQITKEELLASSTSEDASSRWYGVGFVAVAVLLLWFSLFR